uniref:Uncharacterized protein n=1 Tax=Rhinella marina erythrocytic-like virus TaxID=2859906 RepID=A0A8F6UAA6_9VIRU|nr:hypothetical protein RMELV019 [Rhinella marina erythrocytic-like virus]
MEIKELIQENINKENKGKPMFMDINSAMCDPVFGKNEPKYALFSFIPNHIQNRKNKEFIEALYERNNITKPIRDSLIRLFCENKSTFPGVGRIRGCFDDVDSATKRAEHIVQTIDPFTSVMICSIGAPFPLVETGFADSTKLLDQETDKVVQDSIEAKQAAREQAVKNIKQREQKLVEETQNPHKNPLDNYIELRVKYAQIQHTLNEMDKKAVEYKDIVTRAIQDIKHVETKSPELKSQYFGAYLDACKEVGITPPDGFLSLLKEEF